MNCSCPHHHLWSYEVVWNPTWRGTPKGLRSWKYWRVRLKSGTRNFSSTVTTALTKKDAVSEARRLARRLRDFDIPIKLTVKNTNQRVEWSRTWRG